jgi:hypothetical protein
MMAIPSVLNKPGDLRPRARRASPGRPAALAHPRHLTSGWLTAVLRRAGVHADIGGYRWRRIGTETGIGGFVTRVELRYRGPHSVDAPPSLVVKFPLHPEWIDNAIVEQRFYLELAASCPMGTPRCYLAAVNRRSRRWTLVLEDLGGLRALDDVAGVSPEDAAVIIDALAAMHAWARRPEVKVGWLPAYRHDEIGLDTYYESYLERGLRRLRGFVARDHAALFRGLADAERAAYEIAASEPRTAVHGDFRGDNLFMPAQGRPIAVDWESARRLRGGYEVGRFLVTSLRSEDLRRDGDALIARYAAGVAGHGMEYPRDEIERDVRLGMLRHMIQAVAQIHEANLGRGRPLVVVRTWAIRGNAAVRRFDALSALPAGSARTA